MKIIDTFWEKRNLGIESVQIDLDNADTIDDLTKLDELTQPYQVLKFDCSNISFLLHAQEMGFKVIELQNNLLHRLHEISLPKIYDRLIQSSEYKLANNEEQNYVLNKVLELNIFNTDRIALDPNFNVMIANRRYVNWIKDILSSSNGNMLLTVQHNKIAGFVIEKAEGNSIHSVLGGVIEPSEIGIGISTFYSIIDYAKKTGAELIETAVSSNNISSLKTNLMLGYEITNCSYVLVRHK